MTSRLLFKRRPFSLYWMVNNIIGKAKTGTGKTGAYAIPVISMIEKDDPNVQVLVIVPTRELAIQTSATMKKFSKYLELGKIKFNYFYRDYGCFRRNFYQRRHSET
jgi:superfamily II DNA/RNA helicase